MANDGFGCFPSAFDFTKIKPVISWFESVQKPNLLRHSMNFCITSPARLNNNLNLSRVFSDLVQFPGHLCSRQFLPTRCPTYSFTGRVSGSSTHRVRPARSQAVWWAPQFLHKICRNFVIRFEQRGVSSGAAAQLFHSGVTKRNGQFVFCRCKSDPQPSVTH